MARFALEDYAATQAAHMEQPVDLRTLCTVLALCDVLGQLVEFPGGYVAYLRGHRVSLPWFQARDWAAVTGLTVAELTGGPVLYIAETLALQSGIIHVLDTLRRLAGVEAVAGHRDEGTRWWIRECRTSQVGALQ
jgi:hypothetical protein